VDGSAFSQVQLSLLVDRQRPSADDV